MGIGTRGMVSCPGDSPTRYSIEKVTQAVSGQKKFRKTRMRKKIAPQPAYGRLRGGSARGLGSRW